MSPLTPQSETLWWVSLAIIAVFVLMAMVVLGGLLGLLLCGLGAAGIVWRVRQPLHSEQRRSE